MTAQPDGSRAVIEGYGDRVRAIFLPKNIGQVERPSTRPGPWLGPHPDLPRFGRCAGAARGLRRSPAPGRPVWPKCSSRWRASMPTDARSATSRRSNRRGSTTETIRRSSSTCTLPGLAGQRQRLREEFDGERLPLHGTPSAGRPAGDERAVLRRGRDPARTTGPLPHARFELVAARTNSARPASSRYSTVRTRRWPTSKTAAAPGGWN